MKILLQKIESLSSVVGLKIRVYNGVKFLSYNVVAQCENEYATSEMITTFSLLVSFLNQFVISCEKLKFQNDKTTI